MNIIIFIPDIVDENGALAMKLAA